MSQTDSYLTYLQAQIARGHLAAAADTVRQALHRFPDDPALRAADARIRLLIGDADGARAIVESDAAAFDTVPEAFLTLGHAFLALDKPDRAAKAFARAAKGLPEDPRPRIGQFQARSRQDGDSGDLYREIQDTLHTLTKHSPELPELHALAGQVALRANRIPEARGHFSKAAGSESVPGDGLAALINAAYSHKRVKELIKWLLGQKITLKADALRALARLAARLGAAELAQSFLESAAAGETIKDGRDPRISELLTVLFPQDVDAVYEAVMQRLEAGDPVGAVGLSAPLAAAKGKSLKAQYCHARALAEVGRKTEAQAVLRHLFTLKKGHFHGRLLMGELCLEAGEAREALDAFDAALETMPLEGAAVVGRLAALSALGQTEAAYESLRDLVDRRALIPPVRRMAHRRAAEAAVTLTRFDRALEHFSQALNLEQQAEDPWPFMFRQAHRSGQLGALLGWLWNRSVDLSPAAQEAIAEIYRDLDRPADALPFLQRAGNDEPLPDQPLWKAELLAAAGASHFPAGVTRFDHLLARERFAEAADLAKTLETAHPDFPQAAALTGDARLALDDPGAALEAYDRALAFHPVDRRALLGRLRALTRLGRTDDAWALIERIRNLNAWERPFLVTFLRAAAAIAIEENDFTRALACYNEAWGEQEGEAHPVAQLLRALREAGKHEAALAWLAQETRASAHDVQFEIGHLHRELGRPDRALLHFEMAVRAQPDNHNYRHNLIRCLISVGEEETALHDITDILEEDNDQYDIVIQRANALYRKGEYFDAAGSYARAFREMDPTDSATLMLAVKGAWAYFHFNSLSQGFSLLKAGVDRAETLAAASVQTVKQTADLTLFWQKLNDLDRARAGIEAGLEQFPHAARLDQLHRELEAIGERNGALGPVVREAGLRKRLTVYPEDRAAAEAYAELLKQDGRKAPRFLTTHHPDLAGRLPQPGKTEKEIHLYLPGYLSTQSREDVRPQVRFLETVAAALRKSGLPWQARFQWIDLHPVVDRDDHVINLSWHTIGTGRDLWHLKESGLPGYFYIDPTGYTGWADITRWPEIDSRLDAIPAREAAAFHKKLLNAFVEGRVSKYAQSDDRLSIDGAYVFYALQLVDDTAAQLADIDTLTFCRLVVDAYRETGTQVVIKRHPRCLNRQVERFLREVGDEPHVLLTDGSIHELMPGAEAVFTCNSGVGLEALIHLKHVVISGAVEYHWAARRVKTAGDLPAVLERLKAEPDISRIQKFLTLYLRDYLVSIEDPATIDRRILAIADNARAESLAAAGDTGGALEVYQRLCRDDPDRALWHYRLGNVLREARRTSEAIEAYRRALALDPRQDHWLERLSQLEEQEGDDRSAVRSLTRAVELNPGRSTALQRLAILLEEQGEQDKALFAYEQAARADRDLAWWYQRLAKPENRGLNTELTAYLLASGPSLSDVDLERFRGTTSCMLNGALFLVDALPFHPSFIYVHDRRLTEDPEANRAMEAIQHRGLTRVLVTRRRDSIWPDRHVVPEYLNPDVLASAASFLIAKGFRRLVCFGLDWSFDPDKHPAGQRVEDTGQHVTLAGQVTYPRGWTYPSLDEKYKAMARLKRNADRLGVRIENATRGSRLDLFPDVSADYADWYRTQPAETTGA
ncbi:MAG: tetratricopeptide repeat protein [Opitutales bacterium]